MKKIKPKRADICIKCGATLAENEMTMCQPCRRDWRKRIDERIKSLKKV